MIINPKSFLFYMTLVGLMLSMADPPEIEIIHKAQNVDVLPSFLTFCTQFHFLWNHNEQNTLDVTQLSF